MQPLNLPVHFALRCSMHLCTKSPFHMQLWAGPSDTSGRFCVSRLIAEIRFWLKSVALKWSAFKWIWSNLIIALLRGFCYAAQLALLLRLWTSTGLQILSVMSRWASEQVHWLTQLVTKELDEGHFWSYGDWRFCHCHYRRLDWCPVGVWWQLPGTSVYLYDSNKLSRTAASYSVVLPKFDETTLCAMSSRVLWIFLHSAR